MRIAICDDDKAGAYYLKEILSEKLECLIDIYNSGEQFLACGKTYDLLFLDIDMPGVDGIETARRIRTTDKSIFIIYVTAFKDYAHMALSVHAFGYIIKPFDKETVWRQLKDAAEYGRTQPKPSTVRMETMEGIKEYCVSDIYYFEYQDRRTLMLTNAGQDILRDGITQTMRKMEVYGFGMPHKSFCVNFEYIRTIKGYDIHMMNGDVLPLSQKKSPDFRKKLLSYQSSYLADRRG